MPLERGGNRHGDHSQATRVNGLQGGTSTGQHQTVTITRSQKYSLCIYEPYNHNPKPDLQTNISNIPQITPLTPTKPKHRLTKHPTPLLLKATPTPLRTTGISTTSFHCCWATSSISREGEHRRRGGRRWWWC
jgi:hypothetical protein